MDRSRGLSYVSDDFGIISYPSYAQGPRRLIGYTEGHTGTTGIAFQLFRPET